MRLPSLGLVAALVAAPYLSAQEPALPQGPLRVFLDCQAGCDDNFIRTELTWVDYVRDRQDADVHVLITAQATGGGGREYALRFIGLRGLAGQEQNRRFTTPVSATSDQVRTSLLRTLGLGLVRYVGDGPEAERLQVMFARPSGPAAPAGPVQDPWNRWLFTVSGNGNLYGESRNSSSNYSGSLRARRITEQWKLDVSFSGSKSRSAFTLNDGTEFVSKVTGYSGGLLLGRSMGERLSAGLRMSGRNSTRNNEDLVLRPAAVVEWSLFPYRESTRRLVVLEYGVGAYVANYANETVYQVTSEVLARQYAAVSVSLQEPWGSLGASASFQHYLRDFSQNRLGISGSTNIRLAKGLSLNIFGDYGRPRDQLSLERGEASDEEVLLRLRQLQTNYTYYTQIGLSYSFGSIFSAVVNPRLRGSDPAFGGSFF